MADPNLVEKLPAEIADNVLKYLPKDALANLRLASRSFQQQAKYYLYRQLTLRYSHRSAATAITVIRKYSLARLVRDFSFVASFSAWNERLRDDHLVRKIINNLRILDHLESLSITFDRTIDGPVSRVQGSKMDYFSETFALVFLSLPTSRPFPYRLTRLSIENLQSRNQQQVTKSPLFLGIMNNIRTLELGISTLEHDIVPRTRKMSFETMDFYARLPQVWLAPTSQNLRVLHLSADGPWGWYPKVDLRGTYFPRLEDLTLVRFTFSHDWQLQWLSDHADSLKRLTLTECSILHLATSNGQYFDRQGYPLGLEPQSAGTQIRGSHSHKKRWSDYFKAIQQSLPQLRVFNIWGPNHGFPGSQLQAMLDEGLVWLHSEYSYMQYSAKCYRSFFGDSEGTDEEIRGYIKQREEDAQALRELLATILQRNSARA